jgi:thiol-disulfide isomerase/thioredoxin
MPAVRRRTLLTLATAGLGQAGLSGCAGDGGASASAVGDGVVEQFAPSQRRRLGEVTGTLLTGKPFSSRDLAGDVVVYNVWGSWCAPCREEAPVLRRVHEETRESGVSFVGVNVRDNDSSALAFERTYGIEYPSINTDTSTDALRAFGNAIPPSAVPSTLIVDRDGMIAARIVGATSYATLSGLVEDEIDRSLPAEEPAP